MNRRTLLRSLAALTPLGIAGCGEYDSDPGTPPQEGDQSNGGENEATPTETVPVNADAFEVTYSRKHYESDGDAVAEVNVKNTADERFRAVLVIRFSVENETKSVREPVEIAGGQKEPFRIPLHEPVEKVELTEFTFESPAESR